MKMARVRVRIANDDFALMNQGDARIVSAAIAGAVVGTLSERQFLPMV